MYVLRTFFRNEYGLYRQLTCPTYGLREGVIRGECKETWKLQKALTMFTQEGAYHYANLAFSLGDSLRDTVSKQIRDVADNRGEDVLKNVLKWTRSVQLRALQDFAVCQPLEFVRAWETQDQTEWSEHLRLWSLALRIREEHDIGFVPTVSTPTWTPRVAAIQVKIQSFVQDVGVAIEVEDDYHWRLCATVGGRNLEGPPVSNPMTMNSTLNSEKPQQEEPENLNTLGTEVLGEHVHPVTLTEFASLVPNTASVTEVAVSRHSVCNVTGAPNEDSLPKEVGGESGVVEEKDQESYGPAGRNGLMKDANVAIAVECQVGELNEPISQCEAAGPRMEEHVEVHQGTTNCVTGQESLTFGDEMDIQTKELNAVTDGNPNVTLGYCSVTKEIMTDTLPVVEKNEDRYGGVDISDPYSEALQDPQPEDGFKDGSGFSSGGTATLGEAPPPVFPEMKELLDERESPTTDSLLTLSQFHNTAHSGQDMGLASGTLSQDPSFGHWVKEPDGGSLQTPYKGISIVTSVSTGSGSLGDDISTVRNLSKLFAEEGISEGELAPNLQILSNAADCEVPSVSRVPSWGYGPMSPKRLGGLAIEPWPDCSLVPVADVVVMNIPQAFSYLHIEKLLKALPGCEGKKDKAEAVVFFNEKGKELEVKFKAIHDLKRVRTRLGNDIVDFVMSRLYFQYPSIRRHEIQFVTSRVSSCLQSLIKGSTTLEKWARTFLQPPTPVQLHQVKEILVPWVANDHWSLLVFQYDKVIHFDSYSKSECHLPMGLDAEFVKSICRAWQCLRGVQFYDVPVIEEEVCQQPGNYECGHHTVRNALLYLKVMRYIYPSLYFNQSLFYLLFQHGYSREIC